MKIDLEKSYKPSENVIARQIEGETVIVPLHSGIGDMSGEMFALNHTGTRVWEALDGQKSLGQVIQTLATQFDHPLKEIQKDIEILIESLIKKNLIVEVGANGH